MLLGKTNCNIPQ